MPRKPPVDFVATPPGGEAQTRKHAIDEIAAVLAVLDEGALKVLARRAAHTETDADCVVYSAAMDLLRGRLTLREWMAFKDSLEHLVLRKIRALDNRTPPLPVAGTP